MHILSLIIASLAVLCTAQQRCATPAPPAKLQRDMTHEVMNMRVTLENFTIDAYVHVITTAVKKDKYPRALVEQQMQVVNQKFAPYGFQFRTKGIDYTVNDRWATQDTFDDLEERDSEFKGQLRTGTYSTLNLYFLINMNPHGPIGYARTPVIMPDPTEFIADGVFSWTGTMPGGEATDSDGNLYNLGYTTVHEIGHWLGLLHVFQPWEFPGPGAEPSCDDTEDFVFDTPVQRNASRGCPEGKDTCPNEEGKDSIHNYMDYSADPCQTEFTPGQTQMMVIFYTKYRLGM